VGGEEKGGGGGGGFIHFYNFFYIYRIVFERLGCSSYSFSTLVLCWTDGGATEFIYLVPRSSLFLFFSFFLWNTTRISRLPGRQNDGNTSHHSRIGQIESNWGI